MGSFCWTPAGSWEHLLPLHFMAASLLFSLRPCPSIHSSRDVKQMINKNPVIKLKIRHVPLNFSFLKSTIFAFSYFKRQCEIHRCAAFGTTLLLWHWGPLWLRRPHAHKIWIKPWVHWKEVLFCTQCPWWFVWTSGWTHAPDKGPLLLGRERRGTRTAWGVTKTPMFSGRSTPKACAFTTLGPHFLPSKTPESYSVIVELHVSELLLNTSWFHREQVAEHWCHQEPTQDLSAPWWFPWGREDSGDEVRSNQVWWRSHSSSHAWLLLTVPVATLCGAAVGGAFPWY